MTITSDMVRVRILQPVDHDRSMPLDILVIPGHALVREYRVPVCQKADTLALASGQQRRTAWFRCLCSAVGIPALVVAFINRTDKLLPVFPSVEESRLVEAAVAPKVVVAGQVEEGMADKLEGGEFRRAQVWEARAG